LCGTGVHGAYHAGVLRALQEAGVKIDIMAGQGVGAAGAAIAALDATGRLSDPTGVWQSPAIATLYRWTWPLRLGAVLLALLLAISVMIAVGGDVLPPVVSRTAAAVWLLLFASWCGAVVYQQRRTPARRAAGAWWWRVAGAPIDAQPARALFRRAIAEVLHGRGYAEVLGESLGQPGFRELMIVATDIDARRDVVGAVLREPYQRDFLAARPERERRAEVLDIAGGGHDRALDLVAAALTPAVGCEPQLVTYAADSFWRGETHRMCDRPAAVSRLLEELAAAGASQAIIVSAVAPQPAPHRLSTARLDFRHRLGDALAAAEAAALRDAMEMARLRFDSVYLICPAHNPVGAFDLSGAYDEASDRRQDVPELLQRAYEDAYRQFIEPVVGASGDRLAFAKGYADERQGLFDDIDPSR
jgi:hypothetical protein